MGTEQQVGPLVAIVGQTGSGKSALAMRLAEHFGGDIIAADSRTVYVGMDIGTAKPSAAERAQVRHYGLDVMDPGQGFNAFNFKQLAIGAIEDIGRRGKLPLLVGGTGLYIDAILFDYAFRSAPDPRMRAQLEKLPVAELQHSVLTAGFALPENSSNPRHLMRILESGTAMRQQRLLRPHTLVIGLQLPPDELLKRLKQRAKQMLNDGLLDETRQLVVRYGTAVEALRAPAYKAALLYLQGSITESQVSDAIVANDLKLAKRQRTWFKRNECIHWLSNGDAFTKSVELITTLLNK